MFLRLSALLKRLLVMAMHMSLTAAFTSMLASSKDVATLTQNLSLRQQLLKNFLQREKAFLPKLMEPKNVVNKILLCGRKANRANLNGLHLGGREDLVGT